MKTWVDCVSSAVMQLFTAQKRL